MDITFIIVNDFDLNFEFFVIFTLILVVLEDVAQFGLEIYIPLELLGA